MAGQRLKDNQWTMTPNIGGTFPYEAAHLAVLMDLRDELKRMNSILNCPNFLGIPQTLRDISRKVTKPRKRAKLRRVA